MISPSRRKFLRNSGTLMLAPLLSELSASIARNEVAHLFAAHDRAIHIHDTWGRDPYIILSPDGYYYYTGTT